MGNWLVVCRHKRVSCLGVAETSKNKNTVQISKSNGEIVEFLKPILVKEVLKNYSDFNIALSEEAPLHLPSSFELKLGQKYYLIPSVERLGAVQESQQQFEKESVKQIKVVLTRQQLKELLSDEALAVEFLSVLKSKTCEDDDDSVTIWKPELETIPEEHEPIK